MISSINNDSSYSSLKAINSLFNKLNQTTETNKQSAYKMVEATATNGSKNASNDNSSTDNSELSIEDYLQMMQSFQKAVAISTSSSEQNDSSSEQNTTARDISSIDTDGDGTISADEYDSLISQMGINDAQSSEDFFAQFDTDGDGEITASEMDASKPMRPMGPPPEEKESLLSKIDTDKDGTISADEYNSLISKLNISDAPSSEEVFSQLDTNSDNEISLDEILAAQKNSVEEDSTQQSSTQSTSSQNNTVQRASTQSNSVQNTSSDSTSDQYNFVQSLSEELRRLASNTLNAYENNYQFMFGTDNTNYSSNSI